MSTADPVQELLKKRGYTEPEAQEAFLYPKLSTLPHPMTMRGMQLAVETILTAIEAKLPILIWGDYDVDGTTGVSLLILFFRSLGIDAHWHIPNRLTDGYGLSLDYFDSGHWPHNKFLLITVDCGISNGTEIAYLQEKGAKVIVTDHHQIPENPPPCIYLDPAHKECPFHPHKLAGVGVAFYLAAALRNTIANERKRFAALTLPNNLKSFLGFVALGTLADVVPLTTVNRLMVKAGFEVLEAEKNPFLGLQALLHSCELGKGDMYSTDVGFNLAPKVNAAGRYGMAHKVVAMLIDAPEANPAKIAMELTKLNLKRKDQCSENMSEILDCINHGQIKADGCVIVYGQYFEGIIGILASRLVDQFHVPALVLSDCESGMVKGSARSVEGINILNCITECSYLLKKFGGHAMAAGLTVDPRNKDAFVEKLVEQVQSLGHVQQKRKQHDLHTSMEYLFQPKILSTYAQLEPFGPGNEQPHFFDNNALVVAIRFVGTNKEHVQLTIRAQFGENIKAVGFFLANQAADIQAGMSIECIYTPTVNRFNGKTTWQAQLIEILKVAGSGH